MVLTKLFSKFPRKFNLASYLLDHNIKDHLRNNIAFYCENQVNLSFNDLLRYTKKMAVFFSQHGIASKDKIAILLPNSPEFIFSFFGAIWAGIIPVLINEALSVDDINYIVNDSNSKFLITTTEWKEQLSDRQFSNLTSIVDLDWVSLQTNLENTDSMLDCCTTLKDEAAFLLYTSGSTGEPKGVIHSHINPIIAAYNCAKMTFKFRENDIFYSASSMAFGYGLGMSLYMPLYVGAASIISSARTPFGFLKVINQYKPTVFCGVPNNYAAILSVKEILLLANSNLKICLSSGEKMSETLWKKWKETYGLKICEGLGSTESMHMYIANTPEMIKPGSSGKPVHGYSIKLLDNENTEVAEGVTGKLQINGEGFMLGYWNRPEDTRRMLKEFSLDTADLYRCDTDGYYYYVGRSDGLLKVNGMWVNPIEVEEQILFFPGIYEAIVCTLDDGGHIENASVLSVAIVLDNQSRDNNKLLHDLKKRLLKQLPKYKIPKLFFILEKLPKTATGKTNRNELKKILLGLAKEKQYYV